MLVWHFLISVKFREQDLVARQGRHGSYLPAGCAILQHCFVFALISSCRGYTFVFVMQILLLICSLWLSGSAMFFKVFFYYYFLPRLWLPIGSWLPFSWLVCSLCTLQVFWPPFCWRLRTEPVTCWLRTCLHELFCRLHASWCCLLLLYAHLSMCASWRLICRTPCCIILLCRPS